MNALWAVALPGTRADKAWHDSAPPGWNCKRNIHQKNGNWNGKFSIKNLTVIF